MSEMGTVKFEVKMLVATASALLRARRLVNASGDSPNSTLSSTSAAWTENEIPSSRSSARRRGDAEASTRSAFVPIFSSI